MSNIERLFASGIPSMAQLARQRKEGNIAKDENKKSDDNFVKTVPEQTQVYAPPEHTTIPPRHSKAPQINVMESTPSMEQKHSEKHTLNTTMPVQDRMLHTQMLGSTAAIGNEQLPVKPFNQSTASLDNTNGQAAPATDAKAKNANGGEDSRKKKKKNKGKAKVCCKKF
jgi:hypothetical protein